MQNETLYNKTVEWKDIPGFEGYYQASCDGQVKSLDRIIIDRNSKERRVKGVVLQQFIDKAGYHTVNLHVESKSITRLVHRLIIASFIEVSLLPVDHIDNNKSNNVLSNLSYITTQNNILKMVNRRQKTSIYNYVYFKKRSKKWAAIEPITNIQIGYFNSESEAYAALLKHKKSA